jgi:hypothetical protein
MRRHGQTSNLARRPCRTCMSEGSYLRSTDAAYRPYAVRRQFVVGKRTASRFHKSWDAPAVVAAPSPRTEYALPHVPQLPQEYTRVVQVKVPPIAQQLLRRNTLPDRIWVSISAREVVKHDCATDPHAILDCFDGRARWSEIVGVNESENNIFVRDSVRCLNDIPSNNLDVAAYSRAKIAE